MRRLMMGILLMAAVSAQGQAPTYESRLEAGIKAFYRSDFRQADSLFTLLGRTRPADPRPPFFSAMIPFWSYFFGNGDPADAQAFLTQSQAAIRVADARLAAAPADTSTMLLLSGLHGYRSLVAASEKQYGEAIRSGMRGYGFSKTLLGMRADNPDAALGQGVFLYMVGSVPGEIRWMATLSGLRGDKAEGLRLLETVTRSEAATRYDAHMILAYIYEREGRAVDARRHLDALLKLQPGHRIARQRLDRLATR